MVENERVYAFPLGEAYKQCYFKPSLGGRGKYDDNPSGGYAPTSLYTREANMR